MPVIAVDTLRITNLVKKEQWAELGFCRTVVTVNEATAKTYVVGTVLGKVTAGGKYKIALETAVDGSKVAAGIVLADATIAATTDTKLVVLTRGPASISYNALALDATYDNQAKKDAVVASLELVNIQVLDKSA